MTKNEFDSKIYQEMYNEMLFLYGYDEVVSEENTGKAWYCTSFFIKHGKKFRRQLIQHCYNMRDIDFTDFQYS